MKRAWLDRRRALRLLTGASVSLVARHVAGQGTAPRSEAMPACVLTPAQTEGPYFVDERLERSDVRTDPVDTSVKPGAVLTLDLRILAVGKANCDPVAGAIVDIWHCDAAGVYSDTEDMTVRTRGSKFLRGYQITDAAGRVRFTTIYPGAYPGRAVHVHFKVRPQAPAGGGEFTSQLYFDDALTDRVHAASPYAGSRAPRTRNDGDGLYRHGGRALQLTVTNADGRYAAAYDVGIRAG
jgi:protocatechuate 3,4-dioxygenase beta subunit